MSGSSDPANRDAAAGGGTAAGEDGATGEDDAAVGDTAAGEDGATGEDGAAARGAVAGDVIRAAGGVVWRTDGAETPDTVEVVLVHRPRYDDWSLPKGKLERGEKHKAAALREVREETGLRCRVGARLARITYDTPLGPKRVKWWAMEPEDPGADLGAENPHEVSEVRWVPFGEAWTKLTYGTEREVLAAFAHEVLELG